MIKVFISSPYSEGDQAENVKVQMDAANELIEAGFAPYWPLHSHFLHLTYPQDYDKWIELDKQFLLCCDVVLRLPGISKGADIETAFANQNNIPVFYSLEKLIYELH